MNAQAEQTKAKKFSFQPARVQPKFLTLCFIGAGKGKTTAAMGTAVRAAGYGLNVLILQFIKTKPKPKHELEGGELPVSNEVHFFDWAYAAHTTYRVQSKSLKPNQHQKQAQSEQIGQILCEPLGLGFVGILGDKKAKAQHKAAAQAGLAKAYHAVKSKKYGLLVLDELLSAVDLKLLSQQDIIAFLKFAQNKIHIILTGHTQYPAIFRYCHTVTEMKVVKHGYYKGVLAQAGIDY